MPTPNLTFQDWGLINYQEALNKQLELVEKVAVEQNDGYLIFCTHPPVVTLGRVTQPGDVFGWKGQTIEIARGGRATYHGPSQLVVYPIVNLKKERQGRKPQEISGYLRVLENAIVATLKDYGIESVGKSLQAKDEKNPETEETGVWVGRQKIASLGIGVKKWITYHGAAINLHNDPEAFTGMKPCGFTTNVMTNLEAQLNKKINEEEFKSILKIHLDSLI